jgi:hypothetical protein
MDNMEQSKVENSSAEIEFQFEKHAKIVEVKNTKLMIKDGVYETYANGMTIFHTSPTEFRLNFYDACFADEKGQHVGIVKSVIIVHPSLIEKIIDALKTDLKTYEDRFGKINCAIHSNELLSKIKDE